MNKQEQPQQTHDESSLSDSTDAESLCEKRQIKIGYMVNPDPVFFNELDYKIMDELREHGAEVIIISFEDIYIKFSDKIELYHKSQPLHLDGFISYGYMSPNKMDDYVQLIKIFDKMGIVCLYNPREIDTFSSKLNQAICFAKNKVPIPNTFTAYSVKSTKDYYYSQLQNKAVIKCVNDYGGDGIKLSKHPDEGITYFSKFQWANVKSVSQELVPDVWGKSIRVLLIKGQPYACAQYNDKSGDFRSNVSYHENFSLPSMMTNPKLQKYYAAAKNAVDSISSDVMIVGVDLVDSESKGIVVLEVNMWPDMYDIQESTQLPVFKTFTAAFVERVQMHSFQLSPKTTPKQWVEIPNKNNHCLNSQTKQVLNVEC